MKPSDKRRTLDQTRVVEGDVGIFHPAVLSRERWIAAGNSVSVLARLGIHRANRTRCWCLHLSGFRSGRRDGSGCWIKDKEKRHLPLMNHTKKCLLKRISIYSYNKERKTLFASNEPCKEINLFLKNRFIPIIKDKEKTLFAANEPCQEINLLKKKINLFLIIFYFKIAFRIPLSELYRRWPIYFLSLSFHSFSYPVPLYPNANNKQHTLVPRVVWPCPLSITISKWFSPRACLDLGR